MRGPSATPSTPLKIASPHPAEPLRSVTRETLHDSPDQSAVPVARGDTPRTTGPLPAARPRSAPALHSPRHGVLIAYSHRDRDLLGELQRHLKPLQQAWMLDLWDDIRVDAGPRSAAELHRALDTARVVLLLISPGFLASPFVAEHALPVLLAAQPHPRAAVMCLYLRPAMEVFAEYKFRDPGAREDRSIRITNFHGLNDPTCPLAAQQKPARAGILAAAAEEIIAAAHRGVAASIAEM